MSQGTGKPTNFGRTRLESEEDRARMDQRTDAEIIGIVTPVLPTRCIECREDRPLCTGKCDECLEREQGNAGKAFDHFAAAYVDPIEDLKAMSTTAIKPDVRLMSEPRIEWGESLARACFDRARIESIARQVMRERGIQSARLDLYVHDSIIIEATDDVPKTMSLDEAGERIRDIIEQCDLPSDVELHLQHAEHAAVEWHDSGESD